MKQILYASFFAAAAAIGLSSCMNGDYDANPATNSTTINPLTQTGGNGGTGGGGSNNNSNFNWSGTDPMSVKINGAGWQALAGTFTAPPGFSAFVAGNGPENTTVSIDIPTNPTINTTYSFGSNLSARYFANLGSSNPDDNYSTTNGGSGQVQILENDATHIKGKFYFTAKNTVGGSRTLAEGYFNITK
jgi:hypothetical protein